MTYTREFSETYDSRDFKESLDQLLKRYGATSVHCNIFGKGGRFHHLEKINASLCIVREMSTHGDPPHRYFRYSYKLKVAGSDKTSIDDFMQKVEAIFEKQEQPSDNRP